MGKRISFVATLTIGLLFSIILGAWPLSAMAADVIKVGAPLPLTGDYAADGEHQLMGLQMAVKDLNAAGGLLGKNLELVTYDIKNLSAEDVNGSAKFLIKREKVDVVIEGYGGYGPDWLTFGAMSDVPFLHGSGSSNANNLTAKDPKKYSNMFQYFSPETDYGIRAYQGLSYFEKSYQYPNKKIAIIYGDLEWDITYTRAVKELANNDGWEVVLDEKVPYGTTDWGPILTKIRQEKPAAICISILSVPDIASFVKQFMENPTPSLLDISYMVVFKEVQDAVGENLVGVMGYVTSYVIPTEDGKAWKKRFKDEFGMEVPLTTPPSTYDATMIWATAVKAVGDSKNYSKINAYIKNHPYKGLLGTYDFNNPGQGVNPGKDFPIAYGQYQGGGKLAFFGVDDFQLPQYIQPAWPKK